jgi:MoaA/NifB/PqqE/SkfB family radical SAM enzyme
MRRIPYRFLMRYAANVVRARLGGPQRKSLVKPMMASLYVTMKCNFRCTYCDDGSGAMYPHIPEQRLQTAETIEILKILARASPGLNITGGDPTLRPDLEEIFEQIGRLPFSPVAFNTNGFLLDKHLSVLNHIDYLIISLDSTDEGRSDSLINLGKPGQTERVKRNIKIAQTYRHDRRLKFDFVINSVIFPETIDDAWDVFEFCLANNFYWSPMPHIVGKYPNPGLIDNPRWQHLIDEVLRAKRKGARVYGNVKALLTIRDFRRFECYPTGHPVVYPEGKIYYPCSPLNKVAGNLLEIGDYYQVMQLGEQKHGPIPQCDARCHVGCYTEGSTAIKHPEEGVAEIVRYLLSRWKKPPIVQRPARDPAASMPPPFTTLRALPSVPPDIIRGLRKAALLEKDYTSRVRIKSEGAENHMVTVVPQTVVDPGDSMFGRTIVPAPSE